jgi:thiamine biosynthesis lipoprotein
MATDMNRDPSLPVSPNAVSKGPSRREVIRLTAVVGVGLALGAGTAFDLLRSSRLHRVSVTRTQLGTKVNITVVHPDQAGAHEMVEGAFAEFERLDDVFCRYRAETAVARLNRDGVLHDAPPEMVEVMSRAFDISRMTGGAFDPTIAPVLNLYVSHFAKTDVPPPDAEIEAAHALVGWQNVRMDGSTIAFARPGMAVTLDAIAKGFIVDQGVARLSAAGAEKVLVAASGDMGAAGAQDDPWKIAIENPRDPGASLGTIRLHGEAIGSSGDYMQYFTPDMRYNHIIDPRTGRSPEHSAGTTVRASNCMDADAISTSTFVLGPVDGIAFLDQLDGVEGMLVTKTGEQLASKGFMTAIV